MQQPRIPGQGGILDDPGIGQWLTAGVDVGLEGFDKRGAEDNLVSDVQDDKEDQTDVGNEEVGDFEAQDKGGEALGQGDETVEEQAVVGEVRLPLGLVGQQVPRDVAGFEGPHEHDVAQVQRGPSDESGDAGDVGQPGEDGAALVGDVEEAQQAEEGREDHAVVGHAPGGGLLEKPRSRLLLGQTQQHPTAAVDVGVGRGQHDGEQHGVDDMRQHLDARQTGRNHHRRRVGVVAVRGQLVVGGGHDQADEEDGQHEEDQDTKEGLADGGGDGLAWVLRLPSGDSNELSPLIREPRLDQHGPEADKLCRGVAGDVAYEVRGKGPRVHPVAEPQIALIADAGVDADGKDHEPQHGHHLDHGEPELDLTEEVHGQQVQRRDHDPEHPDENGNVDLLVPELDDQARRRQLDRERTRPREPVDPPHGKPQAGVDEPSRIRRKRSGDGDVGCDLSQRHHDRVDDRAHEHVGD